MNIKSTIGGLAGACALTLLNEGVKKIDRHAASDLLGQNAAAKLMKGNEVVPKTLNLYFPTAGDLVTNSLYFAMANGDNKTNTFIRGAMLGLGAGLGAVSLPKPMGQDENQRTSTKIMTVAWYVIGGLIAAAVINALDKEHTSASHADLKQGALNAGKELKKAVAQRLYSK